MKKSVLLILLVSIIFSCSKETVPENENLQTDLITEQNKAPEYPEPEIIDEFNEGCVANIIFLAEGFRKDQMAEFKALSDMAKQAILDMVPFSYVENHLNFYRVYSVSETSGVGEIKFESGCNGITGEDYFPSTAWKIHTNRVGMSHYAGTKPEVRHIIDELYGGYATGDYAYTIVIVNSTAYFGGAEFPGVTEHNDIENPRVSNMIVSKYDSGDIFKFLVRHEFGHSFGNMDDEYVDELSDCTINHYEPWFLPPTPKWNLRLSNPGGWFEGGRYVPEGYWRQWDNSIMNSDYYANEYAPIQQDIIKKRLSIAIECL